MVCIAAVTFVLVFANVCPCSVLCTAKRSVFDKVHSVRGLIVSKDFRAGKSTNDSSGAAAAADDAKVICLQLADVTHRIQTILLYVSLEWNRAGKGSGMWWSGVVVGATVTVYRVLRKFGHNGLYLVATTDSSIQVHSIDWAVAAELNATASAAPTSAAAAVASASASASAGPAPVLGAVVRRTPSFGGDMR